MKRALFSFMLLLGLVITPATAANAQPEATDQTYVSQITGDEIDLGPSGQITWLPDEFDFRETLSFQEEYLWFTYSWSNFQMVLIGGPNDAETYHNTTLGNMEQFYDSWELIDEEITDDRSWFLGEGEVSGAPLIVYYDFQLDAFGEIDMAFLQFTDATTFQSDLEFVQGEITIGGEPLLPNTDPADVAARLGVESGTTDSTDETDTDEESTSRTSRSSRGTDATTDDSDEEETGRSSRTSRGTDATPDDEEDEGETGRTSRTSRGGTDATTDDADDEETTPSRTTRGGTDATTDDVDEGNTSETTGSQTDRESRTGRLSTSPDADDDSEEIDVDSTPVHGGDWSELGLISDSEWESPSYGTVVTWDSATWEFPNDFEFAIVVEGDPPYDILTLQTVDGLGYVYVTIDSAFEATPRDLIDYWISDEYAAQNAGGVTVLDTATTSTSAAMVFESVDAEDQPITVVLEATFTDDGGIVFSQITAAPETIHEVYAQYVDGVEVDGASLEMTFTVEDIQDIAGN